MELPVLEVTSLRHTNGTRRRVAGIEITTGRHTVILPPFRFCLATALLIIQRRPRQP